MARMANQLEFEWLEFEWLEPAIKLGGSCATSKDQDWNLSG